jgi:hypothetical protein
VGSPFWERGYICFDHCYVIPKNHGKMTAAKKIWTIWGKFGVHYFWNTVNWIYKEDTVELNIRNLECPESLFFLQKLPLMVWKVVYSRFLWPTFRTMRWHSVSLSWWQKMFRAETFSPTSMAWVWQLTNFAQWSRSGRFVYITTLFVDYYITDVEYYWWLVL